MPQKDVYHDTVRRALIKDGWVITHDPLALPFGSTSLYIDLGAEAPIGAEKDGQRIAVEVKSFTGPSEMTDLERALGQFVLYRHVLASEEPERVLFLAVPKDAYEGIFAERHGSSLAQSVGLRLVVFDPGEEAIMQWTR